MSRICPYCGSASTGPSDVDAWHCGACYADFPTHAYQCKHSGCLNWTSGFSDYCGEHEREHPCRHPGCARAALVSGYCSDHDESEIAQKRKLADEITDLGQAVSRGDAAVLEHAAGDSWIVDSPYPRLVNGRRVYSPGEAINVIEAHTWLYGRPVLEYFPDGDWMSLTWPKPPNGPVRIRQIPSKRLLGKSPNLGTHWGADMWLIDNTGEWDCVGLDILTFDQAAKRIREYIDNYGYPDVHLTDRPHPDENCVNLVWYASSTAKMTMSQPPRARFVRSAE